MSRVCFRLPRITRRNVDVPALSAVGRPLAASFLAAAFAVSATVVAGDEAARPNVILIYTDDQGFGDVGVYGAEDLHTPHVDALAARGVRFTQMYAPSAVCSPSRAGLMTGRYPHLVGMPQNGSQPPLEGIGDGRSGPGLSSNHPTLPRLMRDAGYATALIGKWHLGYRPENLPDAHGFHHWFGHLGGCIDNHTHFFYWAGPNRHDLWRNGERVHLPGRFFPDLMAEETETFIRENREKPFFIYFAMNTPHYPYQPDPEWLERYQREGVAYPRDWYGAFVSTQDDRIGRLMGFLEEMGLREKTLVIFQADHGHSREERAHFGGGSAGPFRGAKASLFEGGIRVPSIVSWPAGLPQGAVRDQMVSGLDWLPTLAELCGLALPDAPLDGRSMVGILRSESAPAAHPTLHWALDNQWAIREGPWKLYGNATDPGRMDTLSQRDRKLFLSHVERDPAEQRNFADEHPDIVERLQAHRQEWQSGTP